MYPPGQVSFFPTTYGVFPWWPEDGEEWIHPEDRQIARSLIPGLRVFRRESRRHGSLAVLSYGTLKFRVRPTLWLVVPGEGFDVDDDVEILSRLALNRPGLGTITEMTWNRRRRTIRYCVRRHGMRSEREYASTDLRHVEPICEARQLRVDDPSKGFASEFSVVS